MSSPEAQNPVILFDGVCNLCNSSVQFIINRDPRGKFRFAPLQSDTGKKLLSKFDLEKQDPASIILLENSTYYIKSTAALRIARGLNALWPILYVFIVIPKSIRDSVYDIVARNRYAWFGKKEECMIPNKEVEKRFLS